MNFKTYHLKHFFIILYISICLFIISFKTGVFTSVLSSFHSKIINNYKTEDSIVKSNNYLFVFKTENDYPTVKVTIDPQMIETINQRISDVCEKYNITSTIERTHFLYSSRQNSLYCWIRKIASTSFTKLFADLKGLKVVGNYYRQVGVLAPESIENLLNLIDDSGVFKFLVVRHPFERLVSSYRNRLEDNSKYTDQSWIFVPKIFHLTRPQLFHFSKSTGNSLQQIFFNDRRLKLVPTFKEFVVWLLKQPEELDDDHWSQYHSHCSICQMNFDFILKIDNHSNADLNYVLSKLQVNRLVKIGVNSKGSTDFAQTCAYLSTLTPDLLGQLYDRYKIDFEMFDYDFNIYKSCFNEVK